MTHAQILATPNYLKRFGMTEQTMKELRKAGAPEINVGLERFKISKGQTISGLRQELSAGKQDKNMFASQAPNYNDLNNRNEVVYWRTTPAGRLGKLVGVADQQTEFVKIPPKLLKEGVTPKIVQDEANRVGITVEQQLKELGIID